MSSAQTAILLGEMINMFRPCSTASAIVTCHVALILSTGAAAAQASELPSVVTEDTGKQSTHEQDLRGVSQTMFNFEVAPGPLKKVLDDIAAQSGAAYRSKQGDVPNVQSPGITGYMTLHEAVVRALVGTGIRPVRVTQNEIRLASEAPGRRDGDIVVTARRAAFKENFTSAATRTNTPLRETPATVDTVTADVLESRNAFQLSEAMRNIPGAIFQAAGSPNQVRFGSQSTAGVTFTDGLRNGSLSDNLPTALVDSIEVVKGPASILSGTQVGGGLVNFVPKRANGVRAPEITIGGGSGTELLASADIGGIVPGVDGLYFRVIAFVQNAQNNPAGGSEPHQYVISPMLGYRSDNTTADLNFQYSDQRIPFARRDYFPTVTTNGITTQTGPIQSLGKLYNPDTLLNTEYKQVGYNFEQNLVASSDFTLKFRARGLYQDGEKGIAASAVAAFNSATGTFTVGSISQYAPEWTTSHSADLYAKFHTGPLQHQFIVGGDFNYTHVGIARSVVVASLKIDGSAPLAPIPYDGVRSDQPSRQYGSFAQDQMTWGPVHALLGMRESWYNSSVRQAGATTTTRVSSQKWTPTAGLVVDVLKDVSVYGSYTQAFSPQTASTISFDGALSPPTLQTRYETGFKTSLFSDKLDLNGSVFWVTTNNEARADPAHAGYAIAGPGRKAHGFEVSAAGAVTPTLKLTAGYTYTTGKLITGAQLDQSPKNVANIWVVKTLKVSEASGFEIGIGGNYYDKFFIGTGSQQVLFNREFLSLDASIAYKLDKVRLNLSVSNILNRNNYALSGASFQLEEAPPRVVRLVMSAKF
jgi:iron complex outermembrane receptor protein